MENLAAVAHGERVILTNRAFVLSKSIHDVFPLPFNVFANQIEMISERGFPLLNRFNNLIAFMRDSGIIQKLYNDFHYNVTVLHYIRNRDDDMFKEEQIVLTLNHMDGAFTLLLFGCLIGLVTFGVEIIMDTYSKRRRARRNWKRLRIAWHHLEIMPTAQKNGRKSRIKKKNVKWAVPKKNTKKETKLKLNV